MRYFFSFFGCVGIVIAMSSPVQQQSSVHEHLTALAEQIVYPTLWYAACMVLVTLRQEG